ncbi:LmeA family phospholipid-binding protein [Subtercola sp. YIM 133946]|uniref:LmeA family phospholipid-binding protein n=1 Tax=Subtercola sp. YIM 133946 TaxID=3118909 RepID=UPI002F94FF90
MTSAPPPAASSRSHQPPPPAGAAGGGPAGASAGPATPPRSRRGRIIAIVAGAVVLLAIILVVADIALRAYAQGQVRQAVLDNLPANVTGDVDVTIGGGPFLLQYVSGTFSDVTLTSRNMQVNGVPVQASVTATDVSTDQSKPVPHATASLTLDQAAVNSFLSIPGSNEITLGDGTVGYSGQLTVFGLTLGYDATATAQPQGPDVLLTPTGAQLSAGSASIDVSGALKAVVSKPLSICVAQYLPQGVQLTSITPTSGQVTVTAEATNLALTEEALSTTGSC